MSEEMAESAAATETAEAQATTATSAETENTGDGDAAGQRTVPYDRFQEVIQQKNDAKRRAEEQELLIAELQSKAETAAMEAATVADAGLPDPPAGLTKNQQAEWLVNKGIERWWQKHVGMTPRELADAAKTAPEASREAKMQRWRQICSDTGLDPQSEAVQGMVAGLMRTTEFKDKPEAAAAHIAKMMNAGKPKTPEPPNMETDGVTRVMTKPDAWAANKREAGDLAAKGIRVPQEPLDVILAKTKAQRSRSK